MIYCAAIFHDPCYFLAIRLNNCAARYYFNHFISSNHPLYSLNNGVFGHKYGKESASNLHVQSFSANKEDYLQFRKMAEAKLNSNNFPQAIKYFSLVIEKISCKNSQDQFLSFNEKLMVYLN